MISHSQQLTTRPTKEDTMKTRLHCPDSTSINWCLNYYNWQLVHQMVTHTTANNNQQLLPIATVNNIQQTDKSWSPLKHTLNRVKVMKNVINLFHEKMTYQVIKMKHSSWKTSNKTYDKMIVESEVINPYFDARSVCQSFIHSVNHSHVYFVNQKGCNYFVRHT